MDATFLARLQFAVTIGFHYLFPPLTIGLAWLLVIAEGRGWRRDDETWRRAGRFFAKVLGLTFAVGVATGIVMEFQFGTNWSRYSKYVGDIFGAPLAAEGIFAFFLESTFLGLYLFGRGRVPKWLHWTSILMVAVGATLSAFWIIVANSWQQTPAGHIVQEATAAGVRVELLDFWAAVWNPSTVVRFFHTMMSCIVAGAFLVAGISAYLILAKRGGEDVGKKSLKLAAIVGLLASVATLWPTGHEHAMQVAHTQPVKFAAMEGLYETQTNAPAVMFGIPSEGPPPKLHFEISVPGAMSYLVHGDTDAEIMGISDVPEEDRPPLVLTFIAFHTMVALGMMFIGLTSLLVFLIWRGKLFQNRLILRALIWCIPLPLIATQLGWIVAEVGRQPWVVQGLLRTKDAVSPTVSAGEILASLIMFGIVYLMLGALYLYVMVKKIKQGPEPAAPIEGGA